MIVTVYRIDSGFANVADTETATATYAPTIPVAGFYPVYTWVLASSNRISQLYRIRHTGVRLQSKRQRAG